MRTRLMILLLGLVGCSPEPLNIQPATTVVEPVRKDPESYTQWDTGYRIRDYEKGVLCYIYIGHGVSCLKE